MPLALADSACRANGTKRGREFATRSRAEYVDYRDYYGWQGADMTLQHGDFVQGHYYWWLKDKGIAWEEVVGVKHALATDPDWPSTVYKPSLPEDLYRRFPSGEGVAYLVGGFNASYLRRGDIVLIPIRVGAGLRLGANVGYMKFSKKQRWLPF